MSSSSTRRLPSTSSLPGYVFSGIGLIVFAIGLWLAVTRIVVLQTWPEVSATIVANSVETRGSQHFVLIRVRFTVGSATIEATPHNDYRGSAHGRVAEWAAALPVGEAVTVQHHPHDLKRTWLGAGLNFATFGTASLFAGIGLAFGGIGWLALRSATLERARHHAAGTTLADKLERQHVLGALIFVGAIGVAFLAAAAALTPAALDKQRWPVVPAQIDRADVYERTPYRSKGQSQVLYVGRFFVSYDLAGRRYHSAVEAGLSSGNRDALQRTLAAIAPGTLQQIRVNPAHPFRIERADTWPWALPVVFGAAGLLVCGAVAAMGRFRRSAR